MIGVLGTPPFEWNEGHHNAYLNGIRLPEQSPCDLSKLIPNASQIAIDLMQKMFCYDPEKRITAEEILNHPYINNKRRETSIPYQPQQRVKGERKSILNSEL